MKDPSKKFKPSKLTGIPNATFSPGLGGGLLPSTSQDGLETDPFGRDRAHASRSAWPGDKVWSTTPAICGPLFEPSSPSASLQLSLASRLVQRMDCDGSPEYALTWKASAMPSGPPICRLAASGRYIEGRESGGLPTPTASDGNGSGRTQPRETGQGLNLQDVLSLNYGLAYPPARLVAYMMGYPEAWTRCAVTGAQSSRKSRRNS